MDFSLSFYSVIFIKATSKLQFKNKLDHLLTPFLDQNMLNFWCVHIEPGLIIVKNTFYPWNKMPLYIHVEENKENNFERLLYNHLKWQDIIILSYFLNSNIYKKIKQQGTHIMLYISFTYSYRLEEILRVDRYTYGLGYKTRYR